MALIKCPDCGKQISDKVSKCPHCGLPQETFPDVQKNNIFPSIDIDFKHIGNVFISFDRDYSERFAINHYLTNRDKIYLKQTYDKYYEMLKDEMVFRYVCNNITAFRVDIDALKSFLSKMRTLELVSTFYGDFQLCNF